MSFSNPTPTTPVKRTFKWAGSTGDMTWYDRDTKERIKLAKPFKFIVLDELSAISGYSKKLEGGIWSNEVRNLKTDTLFAKVGNAEIARGVYDRIKDTAKSEGGKYTRAAYVLFEDTDKEWKIGKIMLAGSALGSWFDYRKEYSPDENGVALAGAQEEETGSTKFFSPVFDPFEITAELREAAIAADQKVQKFLETRANSRPEAEPSDEPSAPDPDEPDLDGQQPIDLSEIPF